MLTIDIDQSIDPDAQVLHGVARPSLSVVRYLSNRPLDLAAFEHSLEQDWPL